MSEIKRICANCRNHTFDTEFQDYYCQEWDSDKYGEFTDYTESCDEFVERTKL